MVPISRVYGGVDLSLRVPNMGMARVQARERTERHCKVVLFRGALGEH